MKKILFITLLNLGLLPAKSESMETLAAYATAKTVAIVGSAIAAVIGLNWFRTPDTKKLTLADLTPRTIRPIQSSTNITPVNDVKNFLWQSTTGTSVFRNKEEKQAYEIKKDINLNENDNNVTIAVGGFLHEIAYQKCANGGHFGYLLQKSNITQNPCITYESVNDTRAGYSFGGEQDIQNLDMLIKEVRKKKPQAKISLVGSCKGSTAILNYLAKKAEKQEECDLSNIKSVVLESPPISLDHTIRKQPLYSISHYFFRFVFPNYNYKAENILDAKAFPKNIPILIGGLKDDTTAPHEDIMEIKTKLEKLGNNNVQLCIREKSDKEIFHGRLYKDARFQQVAREFLNEISAARSKSTEKKEKSE